jgi:DUF1680 family protein
VRFSLIAVLLCVRSPGSGADSHRPADVGISPCAFARVQSVPVQAVTLAEGIWKTRFRTNAEVSIPAFYESLERAGALDKLRDRRNKARGNSDADLAKWIEAASYVLQSQENEKIGNLLRGVVSDISASACKGGYLHNRYMIKMPSALEKLRPGGYLYCLGHLLETTRIKVKREQTTKIQRRRQPDRSKEIDRDRS